MFQRAVVTLISNPIHVSVLLVHIVDILAVVSFIEDSCRDQDKRGETSASVVSTKLHELENSQGWRTATQ